MFDSTLLAPGQGLPTQGVITLLKLPVSVGGGGTFLQNTMISLTLATVDWSRRECRREVGREGGREVSR